MARVYLVGVMQYIFVFFFFLFLRVMKENPNLIISVIIKGQEHHRKDKRGKKIPCQPSGKVLKEVHSFISIEEPL